MNYNWPLNVPQFSFLDRLKIAKFILLDDQWTQGKYVKQFEENMADYIGSSYAVFVSSGSTANTLLAMYLKDKVYENKNVIVFPSTTWTTSVAPFIREGFLPKFIDINIEDFSLDLNKTEDFLRDNHERVACIFVTSLIGFTPNIKKLQELAATYNVRIMMDNCENTLGTFEDKNVSSFFTSTTSTYFGHQLQSVEGGFIFTNDVKEYEYLLMARNHGMVRALNVEIQPLYANKDVDSRFDFNLLGNNFRNTDINAYIGLLDFKRLDEHKLKRIELFNLFKNTCGHRELYFGKDFSNREHVPFCIPILSKSINSTVISAIRYICHEAKIETRPIISGNLLRQTCYKDYADSLETYPNSEYVHHNGFYIGLNSKVKESDVYNLAKKLSRARIE